MNDQYNGIVETRRQCKCGHNLRLHAHLFGTKQNKPEVKFYVDCPHCGYVTDWKDKPEF